MRQADTVLRGLEDMFRDHPEVGTDELTVMWVDKLRSGYLQETQAREDARRNEQERLLEEGYYSLNLTKLTREANNQLFRYSTGTFRVKPHELSAWCKERGLDEKRIRAVAMGEEYTYKGYVQGVIRVHALGKKYVQPKRVEFGDEHEDKPARRKVNPFGRSLPVGEIKEND